MILQNAIFQTTIQHDILIFLKNAFKKILNFYNVNSLLEESLD